MFSFNLYAYHITRVFIVSTRDFVLLTRDFNLLARALILQLVLLVS